MDEQGTHMQPRGLDLQELEALRAELIPNRVVMRRHKGKRGRKLKPVCVRALEPSMPSGQGPCPDGYRIAYIRR